MDYHVDRRDESKGDEDGDERAQGIFKKKMKVKLKLSGKHKNEKVKSEEKPKEKEDDMFHSGLHQVEDY